MFVPVIFDISPDREARYLGEFYHWLSVCKQNKWRLIATEEYFIPPDEYRMKGRREAYDLDRAQKGCYELPSASVHLEIL